MPKAKQLILFMLLGSFLILFQQYATWGVWFSISDIHHETFAVALAFAATVLYLFRGKSN